MNVVKAGFSDFISFGVAVKRTGIDLEELEQLVTEGLIGLYFRLSNDMEVEFFQETLCQFSGNMNYHKVDILSWQSGWCDSGYKKIDVENAARAVRDGHIKIHHFEGLPDGILVGVPKKKKSSLPSLPGDENRVMPIHLDIKGCRLKKTEVLELLSQEQSDQPGSKNPELSERAEQTHLSVIGALVSLLGELEKEKGDKLFYKAILRNGNISASAVRDILCERFTDDGAKLKRSNDKISEGLSLISQYDQRKKPKP
ncbi:hypothetical protein [Endozoicomonas acroporae]|uniref:hypothetical protein n=1 Tax=Endozoicomonas acroporae TaxID=1701104 RepID=UPI003D7BA179